MHREVIGFDAAGRHLLENRFPVCIVGLLSGDGTDVDWDRGHVVGRVVAASTVL
ncbi:MAG: hypothetical protein VCB07_12020 [Gammaproteobacteria bacterium]